MQFFTVTCIICHCYTTVKCVHCEPLGLTAATTAPALTSFYSWAHHPIHILPTTALGITQCHYISLNSTRTSGLSLDFPPVLAKHYVVAAVLVAHCTLHTVLCTLHTAHCTLHTAHCTLQTVHCTLHTSAPLSGVVSSFLTTAAVLRKAIKQ